MSVRVSLFVKLMVSVGSVLLSLGAVEILVRAFVPVRNVGPYFSTYDPIFGKVLKPNSSVVRTAPEFTMRFTTNSVGFRGPEIGSLENGSILFLGDSFTMGYGVTDGEEYPALVRNYIAGSDAKGRPEIINAGMGNNGNGRPLKFLRRQARHFNPILLVVQIHETDFADNVNENLFSLDGAGALVEHGVPPQSTRRRLQRFAEKIPGLSYSHVFCLFRGFVEQTGVVRTSSVTGAASKEDEARYDLENRLLLELQTEILKTAYQAGVPVLVLLTGIDGDRLELLKSLLSDQDAPFITIPTNRERPDLYFEVDGHWNAEGQAFVADRVLEAISSIDPATPILRRD